MSGHITAIRVQQRRRNRVNIYIDDEYAFSLQSIVAASLRLGQEISQGDIAELRRRDAAESAYERALRYLSYRPRSVREMRDYLERRHQVDSQVVDLLITRLEKSGLLDDYEFAQFWVESREASRPKGRWALQTELRQKGIAPELIEAAISDLDEDKSALAAASRRAAQLAGSDKDTFRRRLLSYLQRRGFGYDTSRRVTNLLWGQLAAGEKDPE